jgi:hypothetical protein
MDGNRRQKRVLDAYNNFTKNNPHHTNLWLMLGDNAYNQGTDNQYQNAVFSLDPMKYVYKDLLRTSVLWPTFGNHDAFNNDQGAPIKDVARNAPYFDIFTLPTSGEAGGAPSGTEAYYSFDYGNIHFICLNSSTGSDFNPITDANSERMAMWLQADLDLARKAKIYDWIIAFWHHPPYTKGTHDSDNPTGQDGELVVMREKFVRLLEDGGVDLVLTGHSHVYERSGLIDSHYGQSSVFKSECKNCITDAKITTYKKPFRDSHKGTVYAVVGCSGQRGALKGVHPAMVRSFGDVLGSMVLEVGQEGTGIHFLKATFLKDAADTNREHDDSFEIEKPQIALLSSSTPPPPDFAFDANNNTFTLKADHTGGVVIAENGITSTAI